MAGAAWVIGTWWLRPDPRRVELPARTPDDDLPPLAQPGDVAPEREAAADILVAAADEFYVARAADRSIIAISKEGRAKARTLARLEHPAWGLAVAGRMLLWTTSASSPSKRTGGAVMKIDPREGRPSVVTGALSNPRALVGNDQWAFVVDTKEGGGLLPESTLVRVPLDGGEPVTLAHSKGTISDLVVDDTNVYFADGVEGAIVAVPKKGGSSRTVVANRPLPRQVVVDDTHVYWVEEESESLWCAPKTGGSARRVAQDFAGFRGLAADGRSLWWINESPMEGSTHILAVPKEGGEPRVAVATAAAADAIASDGARAYWEHDGRVVGL